MNASGWIYNYDPFPNRTGIRSVRNRPCAIVVDDWRGGQVVAINGDAITVRLHLEHALLGTRTVDRAVFTAAGLSPITGDAVACRVEGHSPEWVVVAVASTHFCGVVGPGTDQAGAVARGQFDPGCVLEPAGAPHTYGVA